MSPPLSEDELETAADDADLLADALEVRFRDSPRAGRGQAALFARALRTTARNIRLSLVAQVASELLMRLHLRLEGTMRRAELVLLEGDSPPSSRRVEEIPASQRPTVPPPRAHRPEAFFECEQKDRATARPPPAASQVRAKAEVRLESSADSAADSSADSLKSRSGGG